MITAMKGEHVIYILLLTVVKCFCEMSRDARCTVIVINKYRFVMLAENMDVLGKVKTYKKQELFFN